MFVRATSALVAGAAYALAYSAPQLDWLALPALAVFAGRCLDATPRQAAWSGVAWGVPAFAGGLAWLYTALHAQGGTSLAITLSVLAFIVSVKAGYIAGVAWCVARLGRTPAARAFLFAPAWTCAESLRSHVFIGFPWMLAGDTQLDLWPGALAPWAGVYGVGFALAAIAALVAWLCIERRWWPALGVVVLLGVPHAPNGTIDTAPKWRIAALRLPSERAPGNDADLWAWYRERTMSLASVDVVVWPEDVVPVFAHTLRDDIEALSRSARDARRAVVLGLPVQEPDGRVHNAMIAVGAGEGRYDKRTLVPFAEYTPYRAWVGRGLSLIESKIAGFTPGDARPPMRVHDRTVAFAICYEAAFPERVRDNLRAAGDPALLLLPSSDRWYGGGIGARHMLRMARMRARENGVPAVRVAAAGESLFVDRAGSVHARLAPRGDRVAVHALAIGRTPTWWTRFGMLPVWVAAMVSFVAAWRVNAGSTLQKAVADSIVRSNVHQDLAHRLAFPRPLQT